MIRFDGLTLAGLKDAHGLNLADVTGDAYWQLETDQSVLTRAVCFLLREQLAAQGVTEKQLANLLVGDVAEAAMAAIWGAATSFFRPKLLSALTSACEQRRQWAEVAPAMAMLNRPEMPPEMREVILTQVAARMNGMSGGSPLSAAEASASGPAVNRSPPASGGPAPAESAPAA